MKPTKIIQAPATGARTFGTTVKNTGLSQRETVEETICNLSALLGVKTVHRRTSARGAVFYNVDIPGIAGLGLYQSASNTILELSRELLKRG
ncbi:hypothetical protein PQR64_23295 [Paraburkholderia phytofirmans]|uniref:hypothetical protein n=1 Tax=Paraburkholderia phytofirmans TaxID=261302 RepID=UPI0038BB18B8